MEIQRLYSASLPDPARRQASEEDSLPAPQDSVTLCGRSRFTAVTRESIADQIFGARSVLWTSGADKGSNINKGIVMAPDGDIITGTYCDLKKVSGSDGKTVWEKDVHEKNHNLSTSPAVIAKDGSLLVGTTDGVLSSLDPATGKEIWRYRTDSYTTDPLQGEDGTIYVQKGRDLAAVNADGTEKYHAPIGRDRAKIAFVDRKGGAYVICDSDLFVIGPDGKQRWQAPGREAVGFADDPDRVFITSSKDVPHPAYKGSTTMHSVICARNPETGEALWENEYDYAKIDGYHKGLVIVEEHEKVSALDAGTGKARWERSGKLPCENKAVTSKGTLIMHDPGHFEALDIATGNAKWSLDVKGYNSSSPAFETKDGNVVIADSNTIYCIDPENGDVKFRFRMDKGIGRMALSRDETVVYVEEPGTGALSAVDFRNAAAIAKDMLQPSDASGAASETPDEKQSGEVNVEKDYVIIDGIKLPKKKLQKL